MTPELHYLIAKDQDAELVRAAERVRQIRDGRPREPARWRGRLAAVIAASQRPRRGDIALQQRPRTDRAVSTDRLSDLVIRLSNIGDGQALQTLAELDSRPRPAAGRHLLAESDGRLVAALPLAGGPAIADPFVPTADIILLLQYRAEQLRSAACTSARRGVRAWIPILRSS